jgi:hypothetical protein
MVRPAAGSEAKNRSFITQGNGWCGTFREVQKIEVIVQKTEIKQIAQFVILRRT